MSVARERTQPWIFRTYAGHSSPEKTNELFKQNLRKGQTGLSVAFDLPTQTGLDGDHPLAVHEVGKVGVPISHLGDMRALFSGISLADINTSMTINATAPWIFALYIAVAEEQGAKISELKGTLQNDILKEFLSRGTYIFSPEPSLRLCGDVISYAFENLPKFNPINVCPYHLQEAGATPVQEIAYGLANALTVLQHVKNSGKISEKDFPHLVGRISFFLDSGIRFVEEMIKTRVFAKLWPRLCEQYFGITDEKTSRFRYGVQVNSLGLTESQPENNIIRIVLETLGVTLSESSRTRALQLPAWNESLGLPRPWDQQLSLRIQQILAYETDLLEYPDLFTGSVVVEKLVEEMTQNVLVEIKNIEVAGGFLGTVENGWIKMRLVAAQNERLERIQRGVQKIVGVNCYVETETSPLGREAGQIQKIDNESVRLHHERLQRHRHERDKKAVQSALKNLETMAKSNDNIMPVTLVCAKAGVTTGEWADVLRHVWGIYRAPTGVAGIQTKRPLTGDSLAELGHMVTEKLGGPLRLLVAKPGLDGHSNGAEQIALAARAAGCEVIYAGIRLSPLEIVESALQEDVHIIGLSILSGSHVALVNEILTLMQQKGIADVPLVVGGIIPDEDAEILKNLGVRKVFTPKDFQIEAILREIFLMV